MRDVDRPGGRVAVERDLIAVDDLQAAKGGRAAARCERDVVAADDFEHRRAGVVVDGPAESGGPVDVKLHDLGPPHDDRPLEVEARAAGGDVGVQRDDRIGRGERDAGAGRDGSIDPDRPAAAGAERQLVVRFDANRADLDPVAAVGPADDHAVEPQRVEVRLGEMVEGRVLGRAADGDRLVEPLRLEREHAAGATQVRAVVAVPGQLKALGDERRIGLHPQGLELEDPDVVQDDVRRAVQAEIPAKVVGAREDDAIVADVAGAQFRIPPHDEGAGSRDPPRLGAQRDRQRLLRPLAVDGHRGDPRDAHVDWPDVAVEFDDLGRVVVALDVDRADVREGRTVDADVAVEAVQDRHVAGGAERDRERPGPDVEPRRHRQQPAAF